MPCRAGGRGSKRSPALLWGDTARGYLPSVPPLTPALPSGRVVARAWVDRRSEVDVHPEHRGRGLGAALLGWTLARAGQVGTARVVQTVPDAGRRTPRARHCCVRTASSRW